jgi:hypothetical protein
MAGSATFERTRNAGTMNLRFVPSPSLISYQPSETPTSAQWSVTSRTRRGTNTGKTVPSAKERDENISVEEFDAVLGRLSGGKPPKPEEFDVASWMTRMEKRLERMECLVGQLARTVGLPDED